MSRARPLAAATLLAGAFVLGGCISVLPKQKPAQLYRFDAAAGGAADAPGSGDGLRIDVVAPPVTVSRAAATDQILAITGDEAAFIGGARWVSPAAVLWDESLRRAFATRSSRVRLLGRAEVAGGRAFLRLDVPEFEVRYPAPGAPPAVHVTLHALYTHRNGVFSAERTFTATATASENRVSAIVAAFDRAVETTTTELLSWADAHADESAVESPGTATTAASGRPSSPPPRASTARTTTTTSSSTHTVSPSPRP